MTHWQKNRGHLTWEAVAMKLFAQIRKVDEQKRLVFGRAAEEAVDRAGEVMDYMASKPHFEKWSADIAKATDGASLGNVRAMHGKVAAGKLTAIDFDDTGKTIDVCAKVVDDNEWKKVLEGVYTGFSIGGAYADKAVQKMDGRDVTRYTAKPSEISLVDSPCMPGATFFEVQKADGSLAKVDFKPGEVDPDDVTVNGTADEVAALGKLMNQHGLTLADLVEKAVPAFIQDKIDAKKKEGAAADGEEEMGPDGKPTPKAKPDDVPAAEEAEKMAKAAAAEADAADAASDESLEKLELAVTDALAKIGARNSGADSARIKKIHDMTVELGAACAPAEKKAATGDLAKLDEGALQKLVADAVAPLQKKLDDQAATMEKLSKQPAPARIALRAVSKVDDTDPNAVAKAATAPEPIKDDLGDVHEAAGLIKSLHATGGVRLAMPPTDLRK
jgi:hypothetical protein